MKNMKILLIIGIFIVTSSVAYWFYQEGIAGNGKVYASKITLCQQFAQNYLRTIQKTENITDFGSDKWKMAVDIETDFYNMCLLDLNKESLKEYRPTALEKYQK